MPNKPVVPSGGVVPGSVQRQRLNNSKHVARPQYAGMQVSLVTVRHKQGFETGIGLKGPAVAKMDTTLAEAQKLLTKVANRWGRLITKKIPKIGLDILDDSEALVDNFDYNAISTNSRNYQLTPKPVAPGIVQPEAPGDSSTSPSE